MEDVALDISTNSEPGGTVVSQYSTSAGDFKREDVDVDLFRLDVRVTEVKEVAPTLLPTPHIDTNGSFLCSLGLMPTHTWC